MDRSILRSPDSTPLPPQGERRRSVRQKLHSPVYVSFNAAQAGMVIDLSELLDLNEEGFAVQAASRQEVNRAVTLCLDLPETKSYIHGSGQVIWSDDSGRTGIRFSFLPDRSRHVLKEWLFSNLLVASANHAARTEQLALHRQLEPPADEITADHLTAPSPSPAIAEITAEAPDRGELLSTLDDVRRQVREMEAQQSEAQGVATPASANRDSILHFITDRALSLTGAAGAALALLTGDRMICRSSVGEPAPPVGSAVDVSEGLSGECVRSGLLVTCDDSETDPRVDPELCRALGIGSLMAVPIVADFRVVGLLEVFSPYPGTFSNQEGTILERLAELVPKSEKKIEKKVEPKRTLQQDVPLQPSVLSTIANLETASAATRIVPASDVQIHPTTRPAPAKETADSTVEPVLVPAIAAPAPTPRSHYFHLGLLAVALAVVALVLGYLLAPVIEKRWAATPSGSQISEKDTHSGSTLAPVSLQTAGKGRALSPEALRKLADEGNAEAQWQLGALYHSGDGFPQSDTQAVQWYLRAAQQGYVPAQAALGSFYWAGRGVQQDYSEAYFWSQLALARGDEHSKSLLEGLATQMTRTQVADARQRAEVWLRNHNQTAKSN